MAITLSDAILQQNAAMVKELLRHGVEVNEIDEYGFTPLIEAAIVDDYELSQLLLQYGANPNLPDATGGSALHWAAENNNVALTKLLLGSGADPNAYNFAGQPVLVMPIFRQQTELRRILVNAGADLIFAQDYINVKTLGHMFELVGLVHTISPANQFVEVDFEGFYLVVTLGLISDALSQFCNHFAARQLRKYSSISQLIVEVMRRGLGLIRLQQYRVDTRRHQNEINALLSREPTLIPVGYEGHAITFIKSNDIWIKCDRREDSRLYDNVMFYRIKNLAALTSEFIQALIYKKQNSEFINRELDQILGLTPLTELKVEAQISGNCSWANVEASIPALFFLFFLQTSHKQQDISYHKTLALNYFHRFREWNKDRALHYCIQTFKSGDSIRKACKAEILAAILFQRCNMLNNPDEDTRIKLILEILLKSSYEYILKNYLRVYYFESYTEEGQVFYQLLQRYGYKA